jgi:hypothetical protein
MENLIEYTNCMVEYPEACVYCGYRIPSGTVAVKCYHTEVRSTVYIHAECLAKCNRDNR